jgi:hypothetical protein
MTDALAAALRPALGQIGEKRGVPLSRALSEASKSFAFEEDDANDFHGDGDEGGGEAGDVLSGQSARASLALASGASGALRVRLELHKGELSAAKQGVSAMAARVNTDTSDEGSKQPASGVVSVGDAARREHAAAYARLARECVDRIFGAREFLSGFSALWQEQEEGSSSNAASKKKKAGDLAPEVERAVQGQEAAARNFSSVVVMDAAAQAPLSKSSDVVRLCTTAASVADLIHVGEMITQLASLRTSGFTGAVASAPDSPSSASAAGGEDSSPLALAGALSVDGPVLARRCLFLLERQVQATCAVVGWPGDEAVLAQAVLHAQTLVKGSSPVSKKNAKRDRLFDCMHVILRLEAALVLTGEQISRPAVTSLMSVMCELLRRRFVFHFQVQRQTNNIRKPQVCPKKKSFCVRLFVVSEIG